MRIRPRIPWDFILFFLESIPYVFTAYRKTDSSEKTAREFFTNLLEQISNCRLVKKVLEGTSAKWHLGAVHHAYQPKAYEIRIQFFGKFR